MFNQFGRNVYRYVINVLLTQIAKGISANSLSLMTEYTFLEQSLLELAIPAVK